MKSSSKGYYYRSKESEKQTEAMRSYVMDKVKEKVNRGVLNRMEDVLMIYYTYINQETRKTDDEYYSPIDISEVDYDVIMGDIRYFAGKYKFEGDDFNVFDFPLDEHDESSFRMYISDSLEAYHMMIPNLYRYHVGVCKDCGQSFNISRMECKWFHEKKMHLPVRCKDCRYKRRLERERRTTDD